MTSEWTKNPCFLVDFPELGSYFLSPPTAFDGGPVRASYRLSPSIQLLFHSPLGLWFPCLADDLLGDLVTVSLRKQIYAKELIGILSRGPDTYGTKPWVGNWVFS